MITLLCLGSDLLTFNFLKDNRSEEYEIVLWYNYDILDVSVNLNVLFYNTGVLLFLWKFACTSGDCVL